MKMFDVYPLNQVAIERAQGSWVYDAQGTKYLDMYGGHAVISIGHTNARYTEAIKNQIDKIGFYSNSVIIPIQQELCRRMEAVTGKADYQLFLTNSGAEANENALKLASFATSRKKIVAFKGAFHGRTSLAVATTDNPSIVAPVNETENVIFSPFNDEQALRDIFLAQGDSIAAVIIETIQGVGGIRVATDDMLRTIRSLCDKYGAIMVADEIQCGCARTGTYFAADHSGINADIYTMAKGIGNGFPIGATLIAPSLLPKYGMLGTTFGGNQLACAAAVAVARVIVEENLADNAAKLGEYLIKGLAGMPHIKEVRGRGLMIGIELEFDSTEIRRALLHERKIFVGASGKNIIRLLPALNITTDHADIFLKNLGELLAKS